MVGPDIDERDQPPRRGDGGPIDDERGQAYTLEGIIGAMILLTAVLMALNSAVLLPSTSGDIDRDVQSDIAQQATDVLRIAAEDGSLSETLRCWDSEDGQFYGASASGTYSNGSQIDNSLGTMLDETFSERFSGYRLEAHFRPNESDDRTSQSIVAGGGSVQNSIAVSHTVTLYNQTLVNCDSEPDAPDTALTELSETEGEDGYYPIPNAAPDSHIYNVVEVRLTIIW